MTKPYHIGEEQFYEAILTLGSVDECQAFFRDICTIKELQAMAQRLVVAQQLTEGRNYLEVQSATGASSATISRVSRCLNYGDGGYTTALGRMKEKNGNEEPET